MGKPLYLQALNAVVSAGEPNEHQLLDQLKNRQLVFYDDKAATKISAEGTHEEVHIA